MKAKPILVIRLKETPTQEVFEMFKGAFNDEYHILIGRSASGSESFKILNGRTSKKIIDRIIKECKLVDGTK